MMAANRGDQPYQRLREDLRTLGELLPELVGEAGAEGSAPAWRERLRRNVLPALDFDLPVLLVAICGGGSTGKSTLLNALAGRRLAKVGFRAGLTSRVLLVGHPEVLSGGDVAASLLHRLPERPVAWEGPEDTVVPGPPLYAPGPSLPRSLLLIDTPDFDTGEDGRLVNRERAEPVLRTADVIVYVFTNAVYSNLSNTQFMADVVGGIGGRHIILIYRVSREATDREVMEHCLTVGRRLYGLPGADGAFPDRVVGVYRMHESDAVARGEAEPRLIPVGEVTGGRELEELLQSLDVAAIKRHVFSADLAAIAQGARADLSEARRRAEVAALYRRALQHVMAEHAVGALTAFPANEAVSLATRLFLATSPTYVKVLRGTGRVVSAPLRAAQALARRFAEWAGPSEEPAASEDLRESLGRSLSVSANALRNRLMDDTLIVRLTPKDDLYALARAATRRSGEGAGPLVEPLSDGAVNLHFRVPAPVQAAETEMLQQDWSAISARLRDAVPDLVGLPEGITEELREQVRGFRRSMPWTQRVREALFASLSALPSLLGVTYTLLTANPVAGGGIWIQLEGIFGVNDLWALLSIPATVGLSDQERKQLEEMITPVFQVWLQRRAEAIVRIYADTICRPALAALEGVPEPGDPRFARVEAALARLEEGA